MNVNEAIAALQALAADGHGESDLYVWDEYRFEFLNELHLAEPGDGVGENAVVLA